MAIPYNISVLLIEARDLVLRSGAVPNAYAEVEVCSRLQRTDVAKESSSCVWNATFAFHKVALGPDEFKHAYIRIRLKSANMFSSDDVLGVYDFAIANVYTQPETPFQILDTWIAVPDLAEPSKVCGKARVTITVLGPGDSLDDAQSGVPTDAVLALSAAAEREADLMRSENDVGGPAAAQAAIPNAAKLLPIGSPDVDRRASVLKFRAYRAEDLPNVSGAAQGKGCSPYIILRHGAEVASSSRVSSNQSPVWNEEIEVPCFRTGHTDAVRVELWHSRSFGSDVLLASFALSLQEISMTPQRIHWVNLYGPATDSNYINQCAVGPGLSGAVLAAVHSILPLGVEHGIPQATTYLGRLLIDLEVSREAPKRGKKVLRAIPEEPLSATSLVCMRVIELQGVPSEFLGEVRCVVSFGPCFQASTWCTPAASIASFNMVTGDALRSTTIPLFRSTSPHYIQKQVWDILINIYTFSPVNGVRHLGYVAIPPYEVFRDYRDSELREQPVAARWLALRPAFSPNAEDTNGRETINREFSAMRVLTQAVLLQKPRRTIAAQGHKVAAASPFVRRFADEDEDYVSEDDGDVEQGAAPAPSASATATGPVATLGYIADLGMYIPPMPLPSDGDKLAATDRIKRRWGRENDDDGEDRSDGEADGSAVRSGPRLVLRKLQGRLEPEVVIQRKLFCCFYQAKNLPTLPQIFLDESSTTMHALTVKVTSSSTVPHVSPPSAEVCPAPLWYHACLLPLKMVVQASSTQKVKFADEVVSGTEDSKERKDFEYAFQTPEVRTLTSDDIVPAAMGISVCLNSAELAVVPTSSIQISNEPVWLPLVAAQDDSLPSGEILVWLTYRDDVIQQWEASADPSDIDRAVVENPDAIDVSAAFVRTLSAHWECAKMLGNPRDSAVGLARHIQPWLPVLRPCDMNVFVRGLRDLYLADSIKENNSQFSEKDADVTWRVEFCIPDCADAVLAAGQWWCHVQRGCQSASLGAKADASAKALDAQFYQHAGGRQEARYTPWQLQKVEGSAQALSLENHSLLRGEMDDQLPSLTRVFARDEFFRTDSYAVRRSTAVVTIEQTGLLVGATEGISRNDWSRLRFTNPQLLCSGSAQYPIWLPHLAYYAPDAVMRVWCKQQGEAPALLSGRANNAGSLQRGEWALVGVASVPLQQLVATLPEARSLTRLRAFKNEHPQETDAWQSALLTSRPGGSMSARKADDATSTATGGAAPITPVSARGPSLYSPVLIPTIEAAEAPMFICFRGGPAWTCLEPQLDNDRTGDLANASSLPTSKAIGQITDSDARSTVSYASDASRKSTVSTMSLASGAPLYLDPRASAAWLAPQVQECIVDGSIQDANIIHAGRTLQVDFAIQPPNRSAFGALNARQIDIEAIYAASSTSSGQADGEEGQATSWPLERLQEKLKRQQKGDVGSGMSKRPIDNFTFSQDEDMNYLAVARPAWIRARYAGALENVSWMHLPLQRLEIWLPGRKPSATALSDVIAGQALVWIDSSLQTQYYSIGQSRDGSVAARSESSTSWSKVGWVDGTFELAPWLPSDDNFDLDVSNPATQQKLPDRYDRLAHLMRVAGTTADGDGDSTLAQSGQLGATKTLEALPPWLAMREWFDPTRLNINDAIPREQLVKLSSPSAGLLLPAFERLKARILVYRGFQVTDDQGNAVKSFLRFRMDGCGLPDTSGAFEALEEWSNTEAQKLVPPTPNPSYDRECVMDAYIPGKCCLVVEVWYVGVNSVLAQPTLLGETRIDLEQRWNNPTWRRCLTAAMVPLEVRNIFKPDAVSASTVDSGLNTIAHGRLLMWVGLGAGGVLPIPPVLTDHTARHAMPAWELRIVVWTLHQRDKAVKVPVYASAEILHGGEDDNAPRLAPLGTEKAALPFWQSMVGASDVDDGMSTPSSDVYRTPAHPHGKGTGENALNLEINWRIRFRVPVDVSQVAPRLRFRNWRPMPWYASDRLLSEAVLELGPLLQQAKKKGDQRQDIGVQTVNMRPVGEYGTRGKMWIQVSFVPEEVYITRPVGAGRTGPNQDPFIPEPNIPPPFTPWERFLMWLSTSGTVLMLAAVIAVIVYFATA